MRNSLKWALGVSVTLGVAAAFNDWVRWNVGPVPRHLNGEPHFYQWREGAIYYEVAGPRDGPPLLLAHGINAAASSYEMRKIFGPLVAEGFRTYVPDLLGFGRSERPGIVYTADTFVDLWSDLVRDVAGADGSPVNVIASSLTAAHIVAAAARHPERFGYLLLICPTGIDALANAPATPGRLLHTLLRSPIVGTALFNLLVTHPALAGFLRRQVYADPGNVTPQLVADYYTTAHQPGAKWAPTAFVSGYLNRSIAHDFASLLNPVHLAWGKQATLTPVRQADAFRALRPGTTLQVFDRAALLPHDEDAEAFASWASGVLRRRP